MTKEQLLKTLNNDGSVSEPASRREVESRGLILANSVVFLINNNDEVWLQIRDHNKNTHPGKFEATAVGCIHADETATEAALRELQEETGIKDDVELISTGQLRFEFEENQKTVTRLPEIFYGITEQIPRISDDEVAGFVRIPIAKALYMIKKYPELFVPPLIPQLTKIHQHHKEK